MRDAFYILRKDARHLWPQILLVLAFTALHGWVESRVLFSQPMLSLMILLRLAACAYLAALAVHDECLPGDRQYWLTRPFDWRHLLLSKVLFLALFTAVPELVSEAVSLAVNGIAPWSYLPLLLLNGFFTLSISLTAAALAAVTANMVPFLLGLLATLPAQLLGMIMAQRWLGDTREWQWAGVEWIRDSTAEALMLVVAIAVLFLQYSRRKTRLSRATFAAAAFLVAATPFLGSWHAAFALQSRLSPPRIDVNAVRIAIGPVGPGMRGSAEGEIRLPILIAGIPRGARLLSERNDVMIQAADGQSWSSNWKFLNATILNANPLEDSRVIAADGPAWLSLNVEPKLLQAFKDAPVHLHLSAAFTLLAEPQAAGMAPVGRTRHLPGEGVCSAQPADMGAAKNLMVFCAWPDRMPARSYVHVRSLSTGLSADSLVSQGSYAPFATGGSVWDSSATTVFSSPPPPLDLQLETWRAAGQFERTLDADIRLRDYAFTTF